MGRRGVHRAVVVAVALVAITASSTSAHAAPAVRPRGIKRQQPSGTRVASEPMSVHSSGTLGVVATKPKVYLVFWGKQWATDPAHARAALTAFFTNLYGPADKWGMILTQYCGGVPTNTVRCGSKGQHVVHPTSTPLAGTWLDNAAAPTNASAQQLGNESAKAATHFGNTTQAKNANAIYVLASAHGTHPDGFGPNGDYCGYHSVMPTSAGQVPYINLPYVADLGAGSCTTLRPAKVLDGYFSTVTHEFAEAVTDLWLDRGWWNPPSGDEVADACEQLDSARRSAAWPTTCRECGRTSRCPAARRNRA